jgi:hypothetical protein
MSYRGNFAVGETIDLFFTTRRFSTGAPFTLAGTPVVSAYEDNSTTEITSGITLTTDFDARTGLNHVRVVASGANGFEAGKSYSLVITAGTVDGVSVVGEVVGYFTLERGAVFARLGAPAGASIAADLAAIEAQTDDIGTAGAGLTAVPWNAAWDAEVQSEVQDAIEANNLDHVAGTATGIPAIPSGTYFDQIMDDGTATFDRTTDSLQAIRDRGDAAWVGSGPTATEIADAVWDEATSGHTTAGTFGEQVKTDIDTILTNVAAILADTGTDGVVLSTATQQAIASALLDLANGVETGITVRQGLRVVLSALAGKLSGAATTTVRVRDTSDSKDRIVATVDADGNRTAVTLDAS